MSYTYERRWQKERNFGNRSVLLVDKEKQTNDMTYFLLFRALHTHIFLKDSKEKKLIERIKNETELKLQMIIYIVPTANLDLLRT